MLNRKFFSAVLAAAFFGAASIGPAFTQEKSAAAKPGASPAAKPSEADMMAQMMELAKPGEPHKLLAQLAGTWTYTVKFAVEPGAPLADSGHGTAVRKTLMEGRYSLLEVAGKMSVPGANGKMEESEYKGMVLDGYDNVKKKYVSSYIDNMGTSILVAEGDYNAATKALTYDFDMEMAPGMKVKGREVVTLIDADHNRLDWYEFHGGQPVKSMEINYTREK